MLSVNGLIFVVVLFVLLFKSIVIVPRGYEYTVECLGRYKKTLKSGVHFLIPVIEAVGAKLSLMEQSFNLFLEDVSTKDEGVVQIDSILFYQIQNTVNATQSRDLKLDILNLIVPNIRAIVGQMNKDELISKQDIIYSELLNITKEKMILMGIQVTRLEIKNVRPRDLF